MTRHMMFALCLAATLLCLPAFAETNAQEVEEDCSLASTFLTPHKDWGVANVAGKVRALFFIFTGPYDGTWEDMGTNVRQAVELGQRFDLESDAVLYCGPSGSSWVFHGGKYGQARAEGLLEKPYDLYVLAGFGMDKLPAKLQYLVLKQVSQGAGLLCCGPGAGEYMTAKRKLDPTPPELLAGMPAVTGGNPPDVLSAYKLGKGRGAWLNYATGSLVPWKEFTWRGLVDLDYQMLVVGRAALWAAGKLGAVTAQPVTPEKALRLDPAAERLGSCEVAVANSGADAVDGILTAEVCRASDGQRTPLGAFPVKLGAGETKAVSVSLPKLRAGDYYLDAVVKSRAGTEACGATALKVESDFGVAKVEMAATYVERQETISGNVTLRGDVPEGSVLRLQLRDSHDRVLKQTDLPLADGQAEVPFDYAPDAFATIQMRAEASLLVLGKEVEMQSAAFSVPKRRQDQLNFVMWDMAGDSLGYYAQKQLQAKGHNVCLLGSFGDRPMPPALAATDTSVVPYSTRILDPKDENGYMQPVCWNDEPAVDEYVQKIVDGQQFMREAGVFVYSLGDEGVTLGCCLHPACIAAYRKWLQGQYGTIAQLNASWGTQCASFDEVNLLDPKDNMESQAQKTNFPRWYDRQAFARANLMQFSGRFQKAFRKLDPLSLTGFEGTGGFGDDYDSIIGINDWYGPYPSIGDDIVRSVAPRSMPRSNWMGYSKTGDALSDAAWRMTMKGMDGIWYWMWSGIGNWRGYLRPTLDYWPAIEDLAKEMEPVRKGLGDLILKSEATHSGIAVLYSLPSALSGQLENSGQYAAPEATHGRWRDITYELGLDFRYLTTKMLLGGALTNDEFRVLLLPMTQALSAEEAAAIRKFVEAGGTVIADVRPGIYDEHCKPVTPGMVDDLFGVKRVSRDKPADVSASVQGSLDGRNLRVQLASVRVDPGIEAAGAQALASADGKPVLLVNQVGKGKAILLNCQLLPGKADAPESISARKLVGLLYDIAGAKSAVAVSAPDGSPLPLTETRIWHNGDALVFGMWRQMENAWFSPTGATIAGPPVPARISLPAPMHVYDLRAGKYLGAVSQVNTRLRWGRASFFLALPYRIAAPTVTLDSASPNPEEVITASISLPIPDGTNETFAAWAEVTDPQGNKPLWGQQVVLLKGGKGEVKLQAAHNDTPGKWTVKVTELFSGLVSEASWTTK